MIKVVTFYNMLLKIVTEVLKIVPRCKINATLSFPFVQSLTGLNAFGKTLKLTFFAHNAVN